MRSTFFSRSALIISASCCSRVLPFEGITRASRPRFFAAAIPGASSLLDITTEISAFGMRPASMESAIARKLDPRPERRMPTFFFSLIQNLFTTETRSSPRNAISFLLTGRNNDARITKPTTEGVLRVRHRPLALHDAADGVTLFADAVEQRHDLLEFLRRHHHDHPDAHIEGAHHLRMLDVPKLLQVAEDRQYGPLAHLHDGGGSLRQHTRQIFCDASASYVRQSAYAIGVEQAAQDRPVTFVRTHQLVADLRLHFVDVSIG